MFRLSDIKIGTKLMAMSGMSILLVGAMVFSQIQGNSSIREAGERENAQQLIMQNLLAAKASMRGMQVAVRDIRLSQKPADVQAALKGLEDRNASMQKSTSEILPVMHVPANRERVEKMRSLGDQYVNASKEIATTQTELIGLAEKARNGVEVQGRIDTLTEQNARFIRERTLPIANEMADLADKTIELAVQLAKKAVAESDQVMGGTERNGMILGGIAVAILIGAAIFGSVSIARPLVELTKPINELAAGNFNVSVTGVGRKDEVGQIATAVNTMATRVRETIGEIKQSAMEVNSASGEISTSTTDLSQRTEEQAASLEETTAAMEEISSAVKKSADNAEQANRSAGQARDVAAQGGAVVARAVDAMAKIEDSSRKISDIIGVIDEIARQTNLLALNAAVEAARAGEAGRGFAVVATEVRGLAQRSSQAAKDIKELITNSNGQVQEGVELVNHAGEALQKIVQSVKEVAELVSDIASASTEQATGLEQINRALVQMDEVTQQNAALVEENAATAKALETQAQSMDEQVSFFKLEEGVAAAPRKKAAAAAPAKVEAPAPKVAAASQAAASKVAATPARKPARKVAAHPVGRMQTALATALDAETEWKDF